MKAGIATNLFVAEALSELGIRLAGDLIIESVVDEEFGGVNGTLAGRLRGVHADAAVISEPSFLRVCPAQRGGRTAHLTFSSPNDGILGPRTGASAIEHSASSLTACRRSRTSGGVRLLTRSVLASARAGAGDCHSSVYRFLGHKRADQYAR